MPIGRASRAERAFTLLELITVVALVSILAAIALPNYKVAIIQAREATLRENLFRFRDLIDQYQADKGKYPASLETLVQEGYLRKIPEDPMTRAADWEAVFEETNPDKPGDTPGVFDVKSASTEVSMNGTPYNEW
ncbi:MAG TPA: type II secretion system protein [Vicinamibacteria bacterium]|jgi:general secretion pathway protein G